MEPIAYGFMIMLAGASVMGVAVGAVGAAVVWRLRVNLVLGLVLTACAYLVALIADEHDFTFLRAKLIWGVPPMTVAFLVGSVFAPWMNEHTALHRNWIALIALGFGLSVGLLFLSSYRLSMGPPVVLVAAVDICLILLLMRNRKLARR